MTACLRFAKIYAFYDYVSKLEHFGEEGRTLDRINNDGNYEPGNLRWVDKITQSRNRRGRRVIEYEGQLMSVAEAAEKAGLPVKLVCQRIYAGWTGDSLFAPNQGVVQKGMPPEN